jgi:DNA-binding NarL/FixJ family response regulator
VNPPRVYLIGVNRLVCEAVNALLHREGIELVGMEMDSDLALAQVRALQPDVVLIESDGESDTSILSALTWLVYKKENLRLIRINLTNAELHIYHQEQRRLINMQDLLGAIRHPQIQTV